MPPPQTRLTSEPGGDAAGLRVDFAMASVQGALPEKGAAGPPVISARRVLISLRGYWRAFQERRRRNRLLVGLHDLNERQLMDIGLTQGDLDCIAAYRAFEELRDGTTHLWLSRGLM